VHDAATASSLRARQEDPITVDMAMLKRDDLTRTRAGVGHHHHHRRPPGAALVRDVLDLLPRLEHDDVLAAVRLPRSDVPRRILIDEPCADAEVVHAADGAEDAVPVALLHI